MPCVQVEVNAAVIYDAKEGKSSVKVIISFFFKSLIMLSQVVVILISVILMSSNQMLKVQSGTELESLVSCWLQTTVPDMSGNEAFWSEPWRLEWREVQSTLAMGSLWAHCICKITDGSILGSGYLESSTNWIPVNIQSCCSGISSGYYYGKVVVKFSISFILICLVG